MSGCGDRLPWKAHFSLPQGALAWVTAILPTPPKAVVLFFPFPISRWETEAECF